MQEKNPIIKCPHCGYEYFPAEIYLPSALLGQPDDIIRDESGHVEFFSGDNMNLTEEYTCDHCGCVFSIKGTIHFSTEILEAPADEDDVYIVNLK